MDYIPAGVSATPSWTRWSHVSVRREKDKHRWDTPEKFRALVPRLSYHIRRIQSAYLQKPVATASVKVDVHSPHTSCTSIVLR